MPLKARSAMFASMKRSCARPGQQQQLTLELSEEIQERKKFEEALRQTQNDLEQRVEERTLALTRINRLLNEEINVRKKTESELQKAHEELERRVIERTADLRRKTLELEKEVAERKAMEKSLLASEARNRAIVNTLADGLLILDKEARIEFANPAALEMFGYDRRSLIGLPIDSVLLPNREKSGLQREMTGLCQDGHTFPVHISEGQYCLGYHLWKTILIRDITPMKEAEKELQQRNEALMRSNAELDDFAYVASHDLKEPLRGIHNYSSFLLEDYEDKLDEEGKHMLQTLPRLTSRMESLINDLLQYSRLGRMQLAFQVTDLNKVLEEVIDSLHIVLEEKGIEVRIPRPLPEVECDRVRVAEIFRNFITNAMKYNDKQEKWIEIGYEEKQPPVFFVRDNGIGIREKHLENIFGIFKRLHGRDEYGGGTGVGLTIIKKTVLLHGGRISVASTFGEGTTFFFTLGAEDA